MHAWRSIKSGRSALDRMPNEEAACLQGNRPGSVWDNITLLVRPANVGLNTGERPGCGSSGIRPCLFRSHARGTRMTGHAVLSRESGCSSPERGGDGRRTALVLVNTRLVDCLSSPAMRAVDTHREPEAIQ
jgi:hypothetical protein